MSDTGIHCLRPPPAVAMVSTSLIILYISVIINVEEVKFNNKNLFKGPTMTMLVSYHFIQSNKEIKHFINKLKLKQNIPVGYHMGEVLSLMTSSYHSPSPT